MKKEKVLSIIPIEIPFNDITKDWELHKFNKDVSMIRINNQSDKDIIMRLGGPKECVEEENQTFIKTNHVYLVDLNIHHTTTNGFEIKAWNGLPTEGKVEVVGFYLEKEKNKFRFRKL